ncbi:PREDICTED: cytochrome P450 2U1-like isoform X1 [Priapulus caudatus]|uniref:Cytochrome P450 2U1-like isoform X1 n=1 Tax=Priapulus caudatus TaxID=37621 RepID=A0ABM1EDG5_PRICU|nr:PREDICTED: cytochrome P450 2U1-like isoform X1 [Priapulus caudatus]
MATLGIVLLPGQNFLLLSAIVVIAAFVWHYLRRPRNLPPGPRGLPLVGSALSLGERPDLTLKDWAKTYGPVMSVYLGPQLTVVLSNAASAKDAFLKQGDAFSGRPEFPMFDAIINEIITDSNITSGNHGLVFSTGKLWKEQRKFALAKLRGFGVGKVSLESKIKEEISILLVAIKSTNGEAFDIQPLLNTSVCNVICSIMWGNRFEHHDEQFKILMKALNQEFVNFATTGLLNFLPWLRHVPPYRKLMQDILCNERKIFEVLKKNRDAHVSNFDEDNIRDFTDAYQHEIQLEQKKSHETTFTDMELLFVIWDLFMAGTETTSTTMRWAMLFMLKHPKICRKVQVEIDDVIGGGRLPAMADANMMPFTEATIMEIQRLGNIAPLAVPHATSEQVEFRGYTIPANTTVMSNITAIMMDPTYFPNPERFCPERFLDENGRVIKNEAFIPFSVGRRVCLGESLAKMELFLFFTSILQNFDVKLPDGVMEPSFEGIFGATWMPKPHKICICARE